MPQLCCLPSAFPPHSTLRICVLSRSHTYYAFHFPICRGTHRLCSVLGGHVYLHVSYTCIRKWVRYICDVLTNTYKTATSDVHSSKQPHIQASGVRIQMASTCSSIDIEIESPWKYTPASKKGKMGSGNPRSRYGVIVIFGYLNKWSKS